ncbi:MAG: Lsr2 family protein [Geodermatophilaceae bacterium]|nr:Lsr2 family protein [Geodermatophilaceae bacterium]
MAQRVQVILVDDLDGEQANETVTFGLDGSSYEIDLSSKNAASLREAMASYVGAAHKIGRSGTRARGPRGRAPATTDREQTQAIRAWARRNGHTVSDRGRIPASIVEAYHAAS